MKLCTRPSEASHELRLMEHESSILYGPVNALWHSVQHRFAWDIPDHVIMALLVLLISARRFSAGVAPHQPRQSRPVPAILELVVGGLKDLLHDIIGHDGDRYLYIIGGFAVFIFISNIFGLFFFLQPPTSNPNTTFAPLRLRLPLLQLRGHPAAGTRALPQALHGADACCWRRSCSRSR